MAKTTPQSIFGITVEDDPFNGSVRLSKDGFYMAVHPKQWYGAMSETAMAERLAKHFYEHYDRWKSQRYRVGAISMMTPYDNVTTDPPPRQVVPKAAPKPINKLLLLCNH